MKIKSLVPVLCIVGLLLVCFAVFAEEFNCQYCSMGGDTCGDYFQCLDQEVMTCDDCFLTCFNGTQQEHQCWPPIF